MVADVDGPALAREAARLRGAGTEVEAVVTDVADAAAVDTLSRGPRLDRFGRRPRDLQQRRDHPPRPHLGDPARGLGAGAATVNLLGVVHGVRSFVPLMLGGRARRATS